MSIVQMKKETPPFVRFEYMEYGVDAVASKEAGRPIPKFVPFVLVMQHGSKDCVEKPADEWLEQVEKKAIEGNYPAEWVQRFKMQYEAFLKGNEIPVDGTPVKSVPIYTREQALRLVAVGYATIEQVAALPDGALNTIGLDGRVLRDAARAYIENGKDAGKSAAEIASLKESNHQLEETVKRMQEQIKELNAALPQSAKRETLTVKRS